MEDNFDSKAVINNEYDYSNIVPTKDAISYLIKYCDSLNNELTRLVDEDEEKNKQFKEEYKDYMYKKSFGQLFAIKIVSKSYNHIECENFNSFNSAIQGGNVDNVSSLKITLCLDFYRGKGLSNVEHENSFIISFKPYEIKFIRKSNFEDKMMNEIENNINNILKKFPIANCIFCAK